MKIIAKLLITVAAFFATWFLLNRINWVNLLHVEQATRTTEEKLGELFWNVFSSTETKMYSLKVNTTVDKLITHICKNNNIDRNKIKIHILKKDEVNAFALPDHHLVVFTGLIEASENEAELAGVLCHELAHIEKSHVMKKLIKEVGLSVLISMTTGNDNGQMIQGLAKLLSSTAYDRKLESEADQIAVDYLVKADINPEPFAGFLYRLGDNEKNIPSQAYWITTHPESKERAETLIEYIKTKKYTEATVLSDDEWNGLKHEISGINQLD